MPAPEPLVPRILRVCLVLECYFESSARVWPTRAAKSNRHGCAAIVRRPGNPQPHHRGLHASAPTRFGKTSESARRRESARPRASQRWPIHSSRRISAGARFRSAEKSLRRAENRGANRIFSKSRRTVRRGFRARIRVLRWTTVGLLFSSVRDRRVERGPPADFK